MPTGRPPKSTALLRAQSTHRDDRHGDRIDVNLPALAAVPEVPDGLGDDGINLWNHVCDSFVQMGVITTLDLAALQAACEFFQMHRDAIQMLRSEGPVADTEVGQRVSPWYKIMQSSWRETDRILSRFGFTPSDRARLKNPPRPGDRVDEWGDM